MTLPGGILLALDPEWDRDAVEGFFSRNGISTDRTSELGFLANGFLVETEPGLSVAGACKRTCCPGRSAVRQPQLVEGDGGEVNGPGPDVGVPHSPSFSRRERNDHTRSACAAKPLDAVGVEGHPSGGLYVALCLALNAGGAWVQAADDHGDYLFHGH